MKFQCLIFAINTFISIAEIQLPSAFISYRRIGEQKEFAEKFVQQLEKQNIGVWIDDNDMAAGDSLVPNIVKGINKSDITVCVLTRQFFESAYCNDELDFAHNAKKRLFFIEWNDTELPEEFRFKYGGIRRHTYNPQTENPDAELQKCVDEFMKLAKSKLYNY